MLIHDKKIEKPSIHKTMEGHIIQKGYDSTDQDETVIEIKTNLEDFEIVYWSDKICDSSTISDDFSRSIVITLPKEPSVNECEFQQSTWWAT